MYATVRSYSDPSLAAALAARGDEIRAVIGEVPGFRAYYLVEASSGTFSVTVCDDQAGAEESNRGNRTAAGSLTDGRIVDCQMKPLPLGSESRESPPGAAISM